MFALHIYIYCCVVKLGVNSTFIIKCLLYYRNRLLFAANQLYSIFREYCTGLKNYITVMDNV